jgi:hypothetical protein
VHFTTDVCLYYSFSVYGSLQMASCLLNHCMFAWCSPWCRFMSKKRIIKYLQRVVQGKASAMQVYHKFRAMAKGCIVVPEDPDAATMCVMRALGFIPCHPTRPELERMYVMDDVDL